MPVIAIAILLGIKEYDGADRSEVEALSLKRWQNFALLGQK